MNPLELDPTQQAQTIAAEYAAPPPPWTMDGIWVISVHPVRRSLVSDHMPEQLKPFWMPAGRTLGWSLIGQYGGRSTLHYSEAACGLILKLWPRPAIWIHGLVVDLPESVAGGRNNWHLPKEMAQIRWASTERDRASAIQNGQLLLSFEGVPQTLQSLPFKFELDVLVVHETRLYRIPASFDGRIGLTRRLRPFFPISGAWSDFGVSGYSLSGMGRGVAQFGPLEEQ